MPDVRNTALFAAWAMIAWAMIAGAPRSAAQGTPAGDVPANPLRQSEAAQSPPPAAAAPPAAETTEAAGGTTEAATGDDADAAAGLRVEPTPDTKAAAAPAAAILTEEQIQARLEQVDKLSLSDGEKQDAKAYYQNALQATVELQRQQTARDQLAKRILTEEAAEAELKDLRHDLELSVEEYHAHSEQDVGALALDQLEEQIVEFERGTALHSAKVRDLEAAPQQRVQRLAKIPQEMQQVDADADETEDMLREIAERGVAGEVVAAKQIWLVQRAAMLEMTKSALELERKSLEHIGPLNEVRLKIARRSLAFFEQQLARYRAALNARRQEKAEDKAQDAKRLTERNTELLERNAALQSEAEFNEALTREMQQVIADLQKATDQIDADEQAAVELATDLEAIELQFEDPGELTQEGGQWLRQKRDELPGLPELQRDVAAYMKVKSDLTFRLFERTQRWRALDDIDQQVDAVLLEVAPEDRQRAKSVVRNLLEKRQDYLQSLIHDYSQYSLKLGELLAAKRELILVTERFEAFIAERELWIRSCEPLSSEYVAAARSAVAWSLDPRHWIGAGKDLTLAARRYPVWATLLVVVFLTLLILQRRARRRIAELGEQAARRTCAEFLPTLETAWLTVVVSSPWPLLLWGAGWLLQGPLIESEFTRALASSLRATAAVLLITETSRQICRRGGLAEAHLEWPPAALQQVRRWLRFVPVVVAPLILWGVGLETQTEEPLWSASLGRLIFLALMLILVLAAYRCFMVHGSPVYQTIRRVSESRLMNAHRLWRPLLVAVPMLLGILAGAGYFYTAQQLIIRVGQTAVLVLLLMLTGGLLHRWVLLNRRQLAMQQLRQRRAAAQAAAAETGEIVPGGPAELPVAEESVDLSALSEQTRKLVRVVLLVAGALFAIGIWNDVFPALARLDDSPLPAFLVNPDVENPTTWGHVTGSILAILVTIAAVRHVPSLLELAVLQHLPIDQGARYAIATLARYALLALGIVVAASTLGITGTSISWLVAAMGVGLGFGLQEIFANFVSGIILLFERPIRVGDVVTLGETTGMVTKIRMRATTIIDWDRKEYVVPNKDLVVDRLLNWTLSDQTNRIVIPVGVAYGSDTELACTLLREIAQEHSEVLDDPAALITFEAFGDSTLNLTLRCYLPNLERRLVAIHELHTEINKRFNAAGIEIAFPQRDLHIRSVPPEWTPQAPGESNATNGKQPAPVGAADS